MKTRTKADEQTQDDVDNVIALRGSFTSIPEPTLTLGKAGRKEYDGWCRDLIASRLLTREALADIESYAASVDMLEKAIETGKNFRAAAELRRTALKSLKKYNAETANLAPVSGENPYAAFGFARRARQRRYGQN